MKQQFFFSAFDLMQAFVSDVIHFIVYDFTDVIHFIFILK